MTDDLYRAVLFIIMMVFIFVMWINYVPSEFIVIRETW